MLTELSVKKIKKSCEEVAQILKAMSHPQRLLVLGHLLNGEKTVSDLEAVCDVSQSQLSQFLSRMKLEGLIDSRREGRYQYYFVADERLIHLMQTIQSEYCK